MKRRKFIRQTTVAAAAMGCLPTIVAAATPGQGEKLTLSNDQMVWEFIRTPQGIFSSGLRNKLSNKYYPLKQAAELRLMFSAAKSRIEIQRWRCKFGPDNDPALPAGENGYLSGYYKDGFDDSKWDTCLNLCNGPWRFVSFQGYVWFRTRLTLPAAVHGEDIFLVLGGYDQTDWNEYWVYVNGVEVGKRIANGRWRTPGQFRLNPGSAGYGALRFGSDDNLVAIRTKGYDRHFDGLSQEVIDRYIFHTILCDQFVTVGAPYQEIKDFEVKEVRAAKTDKRQGMTVELANKASGIGVTINYELEGPVRRKWAEIRNESSEKKLLLDVEMDSFQVDAISTEGGYGFPCAVDGQLFCSIEHPSGLNRGFGNKISLMHFPGKWLNPGQTIRTNNAVVGVTSVQQVHQGFRDYLEAHTPRKKKIISMYDPLGIMDFPNGRCWAPTDIENLGILNMLAGLQKRGIKFDYYIPEVSLDMTASSDMKQYNLYSYPDGPGAVIDRVNQLGMKFGGWFSMSYGGWGNGANPKTIPSRIPGSGAPPPHPLYRHGRLAGGVSDFCVASAGVTSWEP
jgi:hypothetical protein